MGQVHDECADGPAEIEQTIEFPTVLEDNGTSEGTSPEPESCDVPKATYVASDDGEENQDDEAEKELLERMTKKQRQQYLKEKEIRAKTALDTEHDDEDTASNSTGTAGKKEKKKKKLAKVEKRGDRKRAGRCKT